MKFSKLVRTTKATALATTVSAGLALGLSACSRDYVAAYVYATSSNGSNTTGATISAYAVDYQTGILNQISGSPFSTTLQDPIASIASPSGKMLYTIGGYQDDKVESQSIGTDGKLYGGKTPNITGTYPTGGAIDSTSSYFYVTYQFQPNVSTNPSNPGPGGLTYFPINSDGSLGTPVDVPLGLDPVGVAVTVPVSSSNNAVFVYVVEQLAGSGAIVEFQRGANGALTPIIDPTTNKAATIAAGVNPSAIISDPTGRFVYVTDKTSNQVIGYHLLPNGTLQSMTTSPFTTGLRPVAMTIDPRGKYLYTSNYNSNNVSGFAISAADGSLGGVVGTTAFGTATGPSCVTIDPAVGIYLYTSNYIDNSISGAQLTPENGTLKPIANTPFPTSTFPNCVTSVANGSHADSIVYPQ